LFLMVLKIIVNYYLDRFYGMFQQVYRFRLPPSPLNFIKTRREIKSI